MRGDVSPLVSIITPTYNHESYIRDCINSVLCQTYPHWEQIIIDDGSTDRTAAIISEFQDPRIHYYHQNNKGIFRLAETYKRALWLSKGSLIAPLEGDDLWPADKLALLAPAFADSQVVVSYGLQQTFNCVGAPPELIIPSNAARKAYGLSALFNTPPGAMPHAMLHSQATLVCATAAIIRRSALEEIGGFRQVPDLPVVDYPTLLELGLKGRFSFVDRIACHWRKHGDNITERYRDVILRGMYNCALEFVDRHQEESHLLSISRKEIQERWERTRAGRTFLEGRRLLVRRQWKEARARFQALFRARGTDIRAAAICGLVASYLRVDLEGLMGIIRRPGRAILSADRQGTA